MGRECRSKAKCRSCHGKHHTSLCHKKSPSESSTSTGTKRSETTQLITNTDHAQGRVRIAIGGHLILRPNPLNMEATQQLLVA